MRHFKPPRRIVDARKSRSAAFQTLSRQIGPEVRIDAKEIEEVTEKEPRLFPCILVPIDSNVLPWKLAQIALDLRRIHTDLEKRMERAQFPIARVQRVLDVLPKAGTDQSGRQLMAVL